MLGGLPRAVFGRARVLQGGAGCCGGAQVGCVGAGGSVQQVLSACVASLCLRCMEKNS